MIIAVDFDGTIVEWRRNNPALGVIAEQWPPIMIGAKEGLEELKRLGHTIIIWTCRKDAQSVAGFLWKNGLSFDSVNDLSRQPELSSKLAADIYIDDRSLDNIRHGFSWERTMRQFREI